MGRAYLGPSSPMYSFILQMKHASSCIYFLILSGAGNLRSFSFVNNYCIVSGFAAALKNVKCEEKSVFKALNKYVCYV